MTTTAPSRATPPGSRRSGSVSSSSSPPTGPSIARGATARSAVSPRVSASINGVPRRGSVKGAAHSPSPSLNGETRESLSASLKQETEQKEKLLVQVQDKDATIATLKSENEQLTSALNAAETRLTELYADQGRMEEEMAARIEVADKLRNQVRELEKEKRDLQRRYNEQTVTFEAERQAFYDNEQHLKSRIQSLTQARKAPAPQIPTSPSQVSIAESHTTESQADDSQTEVDEKDSTTGGQEGKQDLSDPDQEPAEMTALKLELQTLSTSYSSLQSTLQLLQSQLVDLKRVNNELQEENESYNILLRERTLNGQFDILKMGVSGTSEANSIAESSIAEEDEESDEGRDAESLRSKNTGRSSRLDRVDELAEEHEHDVELDPSFKQEAELPHDEDEQGDEESQVRNPRSRHARKRSSVSVPRGESLANLPITGPGLDLAAELGRAENKDILEGRAPLENDRPIVNPKGRKGKKGTDRKVSAASEPGMETSTSVDNIEALRNEVKSLKDANKALSLYASKIIDRIISQEGFEHVLAVDYDKSPTTPAAPKSPALPAVPPKKARPQSAIFPFASSSTAPKTPTLPQERLTTFNSPSTVASSPQSNSSSPPTAAPSSRASRRSLSFDWKSFSMFGGSEKKSDPPAHLRPLTLKPGAPPIITGARKLDNFEDEEDRRERERLHATMKLMGIEKPLTSPTGSPSPSMWKSFSSPGQSTAKPVDMPPVSDSSSTPVTATAPPPSSRFSFFRRTPSTSANSDSSSIHSSLHSPRPPASGTNTPNLTQEALEQAEAVSSLAALDAHERQLSIEIAKGASGGFTEITRRSGDRRSSRRSGSGSTVWSAGMSRGEDED
ncbi:hypothetical protein K474DRAFT_1657960 [Panus rudis PR-1116 ss-1]|nr:hypothetical protein K474DRAFT_1657960 [Panus rudis PR-1116 ss-1]